MAIPVSEHAALPVRAQIIETDIPARLDRLHWGRFHTLVVVALGITWILDGLEVTLAGAIAPALKESAQLHFSNADVGLASSAYLAAAGPGLALRVLHRRRTRPHYLLHAAVAAGVPALADDARPLRRSRRHPR